MLYIRHGHRLASFIVLSLRGGCCLLFLFTEGGVIRGIN